MSVYIRAERPEDFPIIHQIVRLAFEHAEHADHTEHFLVQRLRQSSGYISELALVAEKDEQILGHIMFTKISVSGYPALSLAPVAVHPSCQGKGIGGMLIRHGHNIARAMGWEYVILLGHANYYPRFGYVRASSFGMSTSFEAPDENFMAINLQNNGHVLSGVVEYPSLFFEKSGE